MDGALTDTIAAAARPPRQRQAVIDCDVHHETKAFPLDEELGGYLSTRWRRYLETFGMRAIAEAMAFVPHRAVGEGAVARLDTLPPSGLEPGSDRDFAREQLLDGQGIDVAILNSFGGLGMNQGNMPVELGIELSRAYNDWTHDYWLQSDPRWRSSICVPYEHPEAAVAEIERCHALSDRFLQVLLPSRTMAPIGNPRYWPIFEAAVELGLPVGFHVGYCRSTPLTACGAPNYYYEHHVDFALQPFTLVPSLIFEGVFDRFPELSIVLAELGWAWAVPLAWRMDSAWAAMRDEGLELDRLPSEYLWDRFWFTTQPSLQTTDERWTVDAIEQIERIGGADKLIYSSDYPHWDYDPPAQALPGRLSRESKQRILAGNAAALYGIELD